jgi:hypothetical protein
MEQTSAERTGTAVILGCGSSLPKTARHNPAAREPKPAPIPVMNGMGESLKIGDVARRLGVSASLVRAWERLGLTQPARTDSKYRIYTS